MITDNLHIIKGVWVEIKVAKTAGFCFGVDRAVVLVYNEIQKGENVNFNHFLQTGG